MRTIPPLRIVLFTGILAALLALAFGAFTFRRVLTDFIADFIGAFIAVFGAISMQINEHTKARKQKNKTRDILAK